MLRRWISALAVWGLLLHAMLLVQHNSVMLNSHLAYGALLKDLTVICAQMGAANMDGADLPHVPRPAETQPSCPVCSGLVAAFALASPPPFFLPIGAWESYKASPLTTLAVADASALHLPPARAPPRV